MRKEIVTQILENSKKPSELSETMKYCPTCQTEYDEEILRFCTKDGTPLIDETQPHFTELPSVTAEEDDFGEETLIRKDKPEPPLVVPDFVEDTAVEPARDDDAPRLVIPTQEPQVRAKTTASYRPPPAPPKSNTALVVVTTILLTLVVLGGIAGLFWMMGNNDNGANVNVNTNPPDNLNVNTNLGVNIPPANFDSNFNSNLNFNINSININSISNANVRTPSPTRTPSPSPSPSASPDANANANAPTRTPTPALPPRTPTPNTTPPPLSTPAASPVNLGVLNGRAVNLPKPAYPSSARQMGANGQVAVRVTVDEAGNVTSAKATNGHPLLRQSAEAAARQTKFNPISVGDQIVRASGFLVYNFVNQ